ncbi:hypothetical protein E2L08_09615 [Palleronia sediminis]|uniref:PhiE125 gp8 family phage protein n=1 Tax=Palleronia sediminis TaxID=2547833 RepID=A0A4R6A9P5_9RHOB|nr:hypothetical protein [Palleronia sediminis]TDL79552.1 hypothetical protein E2L08_09615 [Palleronia sediminis]
MYLTELSEIAAGDLPVGQLRRQLRLGTGFADDAAEDAALARTLRQALAQVEALTGRAVLRRAFRLSVDGWRMAGRQALPRGPLVSVASMTLFAPDGAAEEVALDRVHVARGPGQPALVARGFGLPAIPAGGHCEIVFEAGLAASWSEVPGDMAAAVLALAVQRHDDVRGLTALPRGVAELLAPYRVLRLAGAW